MAARLLNRYRRTIHLLPLEARRAFRSDAALEAIAKASEEKVPNVVLYNYPSFSGAYAALFAHLYHTRLNLHCLILPFSSVAPLRVDDFYVEGLERFYFLDLYPHKFASEILQRSSCEIIAFEHRKSVLSQLLPGGNRIEKLSLYQDIEKSSSKTVYEYFSSKLADANSTDKDAANLLNPEEKDSVETVLKYIEDVDLRRWSVQDIRSFSIGLKEWRSKINCLTNPYIY